MEIVFWLEFSNFEIYKDRLFKNFNSELISGGRVRICFGDMNRICGGGGLGKFYRIFFINVYRSYRIGKYFVGDCRNLGFVVGIWKYLSKRIGYVGIVFKGG